MINLFPAVERAVFRLEGSLSAVLYGGHSAMCPYNSRETQPPGSDSHGCLTLHFAKNRNEHRAKSLKTTLPIAVSGIKNTLTIFVLILILTASSGAAEMEEYHGPEITVRYDAPLKDAAIRIASVYRKTRTDIEAKLGWRLRIDPVVVLIGSNAAFQEMAGNKLVTAFAATGRDLIVIDYSRMDRVPFDLEDTFKHELTHILLHQRIGDSYLPKWLDEGIAQWASGGIADIMRTGDKDLLQQAVLSHRVLSLTEISSNFPVSPDSLLLAYEESKSFTEFIVKYYGEARLRLILQSLEKQGTIQQAIYDNYGVSMDTLEQKWKKGLIRENSWIAYMADHMYWLLFFLAALITVAGYCAVKRRMRDYRDEEDEAEGGESKEQSEDV